MKNLRQLSDTMPDILDGVMALVSARDHCVRGKPSGFQTNFNPSGALQSVEAASTALNMLMDASESEPALWWPRFPTDK